MSRTVNVDYGGEAISIVPIPSALWGLDAAGDFENFVYGEAPGKLIGVDATGVLTFYDPAGLPSPIGGSGFTTIAGAAYTVQPGDDDNTLAFTSAAPVTVTLPNNLPMGFAVELLQQGVGTVTAHAAPGGSQVSPGGDPATLFRYASLLCTVIANAGGINAQWNLVVPGSIPGMTFTDNFQGSGQPAAMTTGPFSFVNVAAKGNDGADFTFLGNYGYTGGTPFNSHAPVRVYTTVGPNVGDFVWGFLSVLLNSATAGQNAAGYFQARKMTAAAGETWGMLSEAMEMVATNNPTVGLVGIELDMDCNGTDANGSRVGFDLAVRQNSLVASSAFAQVGWGFRIQNGGVVGNSVGTGYGFYPGMIAAVGFDTSQATIQSAAYQLAQGQAIVFDGPTSRQNVLLYTGGGLSYRVGGVDKVILGATGALYLNGKQVLGSQIPGYGTPTGGARQASFAASTITLPLLAAAVAQLIVDLKSHGMIAT